MVAKEIAEFSSGVKETDRGGVWLVEVRVAIATPVAEPVGVGVGVGGLRGVQDVRVDGVKAGSEGLERQAQLAVHRGVGGVPFTHLKTRVR